MKVLAHLFFLSCIYGGVQAQVSPRQLPAKRFSETVRIDGLLTDSAWKNAAVLSDLTEFRPKAGDKENPFTKTVAYLMYNDEGIYFGGYCYETTRDSIARELSGRDGFGTNDYIGLILDTYYDQLNGFEYFVTPLNEQWDAKMSPAGSNGNSEDFSWNAVWQSGAVIHDDGWSFEMFIPFSAIRFGKKEVQNWGLNITRRRRKTEEQFSWNPVNPTVSGFLTQEGIWTGISDIKPPLRLQFSPYFSTYANHFPASVPGEKSWTSSINGGMDVKYGISQAITLDMTLIPDFGQVQSDNQVLNLTPFEVRFNENRSFFTEGTELFGNGNLFYSRRVGGTPLKYYSLQNEINANEHVVKNPSETKLINATKLSGRMQNGLGVGFFNAITAPQHAIIEDDLKHQRKIQTNPLTNYNIIVLNQSLKNNSSVSLVNTNVWRNGADYDANVTAALFDFTDKKNTWNAGGKLASSNLPGYLPGGKTLSGYSHNIYFGKKSGRFNFNISQELSDKKYNNNDLGYFTYNNFIDHSLWMGYRWIQPTNWYNNIRINFNGLYTRRLLPSAYRGANFNVNVNGQLKNLWYAGTFFGHEPKGNDFFEPRAEGRVFKGWSSFFIGAWFQTNNAKKYTIYNELFYVTRSLFNSKKFQFDFNQRFRFNDKFSVRHAITIEPQKDNTGFAGFSGNEIIFGRRDRNTIDNQLNLKYNFNSKMGWNVRVRHYWSKVEYAEFFTLLPSGNLGKNDVYNENVNRNVNIFNVDMTYTWQFAPGSFLDINWKNSAFNSNDFIEKNYFKNFSNTMQTDQNNNISLKVIYFLDYITFQKRRNKK